MHLFVCSSIPQLLGKKSLSPSPHPNQKNLDTDQVRLVISSRKIWIILKQLAILKAMHEVLEADQMTFS